MVYLDTIVVIVAHSFVNVVVEGVENTLSLGLAS